MRKPARFKKLLPLAVLPFAILALTGVAEAQSGKGMSSIRPAAQAESPEEKMQKEHKAPKEKAKRQTKDQKLNSCKRHPGCKAKLEAAMKKTPGRRPLPSATQESPEEIERKKHAPPEPKPQKRSMLSPTRQSVGSFLSKLNPIQTAMAQESFSVFLTVANSIQHQPTAYLQGYFVGAGHTNSFHRLNNANVPNSTCQNRPCDMLKVNITTTGDYIINFRAYGYNGTGRLRHHYNGPIVSDWNFTGTGYSTRNYATVEYLEAGSHYFYFFSPTTWLYLYSVSVEPVELR